MEEPADIRWRWIDRIFPLLLVSLPFGFFIVGNSIFIDSCSVHWIEPRESRAEYFTSVNSWECFFRGLCAAGVCVCTISGRGKWGTPRRLWNRPVCGTSAWWWWRQKRHRWTYWMPGKKKKMQLLHENDWDDLFPYLVVCGLTLYMKAFQGRWATDFSCWIKQTSGVF